MLKRCVLLVTLLYTPFLYAQSEAECLSAGKIAQGSAVLMHEGQSEEYVIDVRNGQATSSTTEGFR
jgi:hypothetical protein